MNGIRDPKIKKIFLGLDLLTEGPTPSIINTLAQGPTPLWNLMGVYVACFSFIFLI